ncbi:GNAT family N-acetyltransferase [Faunimonas sp. B44]|uniref:GNAT family N-acetyltransferase n=1 Tax=Faunimonas sp. B44 TaxID=3461493 RepID=UPI004043D224
MRGRQRRFSTPFSLRMAPGGVDHASIEAGVRPFGRAWRAPWRAAKDVGVLGRIGTLEARLARAAAEVRRAQALRYHVFYEEMSAIADMRTQLLRRDVDAFDLICDHLLVIDHTAPKRPLFRQKPEIVGTYRLLRQDVAEANGGFYSASEYNVAPLLEARPDLRFLELGRSCVLKPYRNKRTVELLWHGVWSYVLMHGVDVMIGCASLEGTDPDRLALPLSFLHHTAKAPPEWNVRALDHLYVDMNRIPAASVDAKEALRTLPPLIKGYLRIGAFIGDGAVVDHQFGTTDVMIVLPVSAISERYINHYGADAGRYAS